MNQKPTKVFMLFLCLALILSGCMQSAGSLSEGMAGKVPAIPEKLQRNGEGIPTLKVYDVKQKTVSEMDLESYIMGVVAGEMKDDWPMEALKAQAILARTFTLKFVSDKESRYPGADISTDVQEAQAYNVEAVNDRIREAVNATRGVVMTSAGELPYAWFHAHAGGMTELPSKALEFKSDPAYLAPVQSPDSEKAPANVQSWTAVFSLDQVSQACRAMGVDVESVESFELGEKGESGRAVSFLVNGKTVSAPSFRLQIGASELKSTLISRISIQGNQISFTGSGSGHGVGMSQWGAYDMAEQGKDAKEIIAHYFTGVDLTELW